MACMAWLSGTATCLINVNKMLCTLFSSLISSLNVTVPPGALYAAAQRYRALFGLRNKGGKEAVEAMCSVFGARSALLKHEVAYVLGQVQSSHSVQALTHVLQDPAEHAM